LCGCRLWNTPLVWRLRRLEDLPAALGVLLRPPVDLPTAWKTLPPPLAVVLHVLLGLLLRLHEALS